MDFGAVRTRRLHPTPRAKRSKCGCWILRTCCCSTCPGRTTTCWCRRRVWPAVSCRGAWRTTDRRTWCRWLSCRCLSTWSTRCRGCRCCRSRASTRPTVGENRNRRRVWTSFRGPPARNISEGVPWRSATRCDCKTKKNKIDICNSN